MIPLKDTEQSTTTTTFLKRLNDDGIPKTMNSDQGLEFKHNTLQYSIGKHVLSK